MVDSLSSLKGAFLKFSLEPKEIPDIVRERKKPTEPDWQEWERYWETKYITTLGTTPYASFTERGKNKRMILAALKLRGEELFRSMIDFVFDNHVYHPEWKYLSLSLVCGSHGFAESIAKQCETYSGNQQLELASW
jgi:hypothetical protein